MFLQIYIESKILSQKTEFLFRKNGVPSLVKNTRFRF